MGDETFHLLGVGRVKANVEKVLDEIRNKAVQGLYETGVAVAEKAQSDTPVRSGALQSTGEAFEPVKEGNEFSVTISFGDEDSGVNYAVVVHEDLDAHHTIGKAKFLESAINEEEPLFPMDIKRRGGL